MATSSAALEKMREICLSFPETREGIHFGQTAFYVKDKLWAICGDKHGVWQIAFGLELDHAAALAENDPRFKLHPRDKRGVVMDVADVKGWGEIKALLVESYGRLKPQTKPARKEPAKKERAKKERAKKEPAKKEPARKKPARKKPAKKKPAPVKRTRK